MPNASESLQPDLVLPNKTVSTPVKAQRLVKPVEAVTPDNDIQKPFRETTTPVVKNVPNVPKNNTPSETVNFSKENPGRQRELSTASEADPTGFKILKVHPANEKPSLNSDDESSQITPTQTESSATPAFNHKELDKTLQLDQPLPTKSNSETSESTPRLTSPSDETLVKQAAPVAMPVSSNKGPVVPEPKNFIVLSNADSENTIIPKTVNAATNIVQPVNVKKPKSRWVKANPHGFRGRWHFHDKAPPKGSGLEIGNASSTVNASISNNSIVEGSTVPQQPQTQNNNSLSSNINSSNLTSSTSQTQVQNVGNTQDVNKKGTEIHNATAGNGGVAQAGHSHQNVKSDQKMPHVPVHRPVTVKAVNKNIPPIKEELAHPVKSAQSTPAVTQKIQQNQHNLPKLKVQNIQPRNLPAQQQQLAAGENIPFRSVDYNNGNDINTAISEIVRIQNQQLEATLSQFLNQHISQKYEAKIQKLESQLKSQAESDSKIQRLEKRVEELEQALKERDAKCNPSQFAAQNRKIKRLELEKKQLEDSNLLLKSQVENRDKDFLEYNEDDVEESSQPLN